MKISIQFFIGCLLLSSCGNYVNQKTPAPDNGKSLSPSSSLEFASVKAAIFANKAGPHCTNCHTNFDSYSSIRRDLAAIEEAVDSGRMPKDGPSVSPDLRAFLSRWIAAGAPEFAGQPPPPLPPVVLTPNWQSISENILQPKCVVCHNPNGQAKFLDLSNRLALLRDRNCPPGRDCGGKKLLDFDHPENSYLLEVINDPTEPMPPIWSRITRLNSEEVKALSDWIGLGIP